MLTTNVTTLLREFPKIRRAAMAGEVVIIQTREGNLRLTADGHDNTPSLGCLAGRVLCDDRIDRPTTEAGEWRASL